MAGGMHAAALGSGINPLGEWREGPSLRDEEVHRTLQLGCTAMGAVEVGTLSEEMSEKAAWILQERHIQSNPVKAYTRMCHEGLTCQDGGDLPPQSRTLKKTAENPAARILVSVLPILTWLPQLSFKSVRADVIAGITVGIMVIPQSMSYGSIAGLPYIYGMYSACVPTLIYAFLGQSRQLAVGPVAMVSLLVHAGLQGVLTQAECPAWYEAGGEDSGIEQYELCPDKYVVLATLTAATVGVMQVVASILRLGFLVSFLGHPVTSGFTSAAAIIIGLSQLKHVLGYDIPKSQFVYQTMASVIKDLNQTKIATLILGLLTLAFLIINKKMAQKYKRLSMLAPLGPLICCGFGTLMIWLWPLWREEYHVKYVGEIPSGLMPLSVSGWRVADISKVLPTALSACLIGYMESIAIGKNLAAKHGYEIEAGQEMLALGVSNLVGSVFSCYPVTGSFSRSAVNNSTGAVSQFSGVVTATVMFCTLMFLTPLFYFLPKYVLAAIVMNSVIPLVAFGEARKLWTVKREDFVLWIVAFIGTLFLGVLMGIAVAVSLSLIIVIYESVRPQITILWRIPGTTIYRNMKQESSGVFVPNVFICRIGSSMYFANASFVKDMLLRYVADLEEVNKTEYIVLEMTPVVSIDSTAVHAIQDVVNDFRSRGIQTALAMVGNRVEKTMRKARLTSFVGEQWFFPNVDEAVQYCLRHQHLKRLREKQSANLALGNGNSNLEMIAVHHGKEIGFSNDLHSSCTMVFLSLVEDVPMITAEIANAFKRSRVTIVQATIEPMNDKGAKHTYLLKSLKTDRKLSDGEVDRLREELSSIWSLQRTVGPTPSGQEEHTMNVRNSWQSSSTWSGTAGGTDEQYTRIGQLEEALSIQQASHRLMQQQLEEQNARIEALLRCQGGLAEGAELSV